MALLKTHRRLPRFARNDSVLSPSLRLEYAEAAISAHINRAAKPLPNSVTIETRYVPITQVAWGWQKLQDIGSQNPMT